MGKNRQKIILSKNIYYLMERHDLNQTELAKKLGVKREVLVTWLHQITYPRDSSIQLLADFFKVPISDLTEQLIAEQDSSEDTDSKE